MMAQTRVHEAVGEGTLFDGVETVNVRTPWWSDVRSVDESYATVGGGCELGSGHYIVWRGRGNRVWLAEGALSQIDDESMEGERVVAIVDLEGEVSSACDIFDDGDMGIWFCGTTKTRDAVRIHLIKNDPASRFTLLAENIEATECQSIQIEKLWNGEPSGPRVWSDAGTLYLGSTDGGVARIDLNSRRCRYARGGSGWSSLLFSASKNRKRGSIDASSVSKNEDQSVIALKAENGFVVCARADASIVLWSMTSFPSQSWSVKLPLPGGAATDVAVTNSAVWAASPEGLVQFGMSTGNVSAVLPLPGPCISLLTCEIGVWASTEYDIFAFYGENNEHNTYEQVVLLPDTERQGGRRKTRNDELEARLNESLRSATCIGAAFGLKPEECDDWSKVSEAIETYFLHRLGQPWIFGPHACADALTRDLPEVLRRTDGSADSALAAARSWYRLASARAGGVEAKAEVYVDCWRQLVEMVKRRDERGRAVVGSFCCSTLAPLCLVRADGTFCLCLELTAQNSDTMWTQTEELFAQMRESTVSQLDNFKPLDDTIKRAVFENSFCALDEVQFAIRDTAREAAALDVDWAIECLSRVRVDDEPLVSAQLALFGKSNATQDDGQRLSPDALGILSRSVRQAARRAYERCRSVAMVLAVAEAMGGKYIDEALAVVCSLTCEMRLIERMASTAPLEVPLEVWPERRSVLEQILGQSYHLIKCTLADLECPALFLNRLVARSQLTHAALMDIMDRRVAWRHYARHMSDVALSETRAFGDGLAQLFNNGMTLAQKRTDYLASTSLRLGDCARSRHDANFWFAGVVNAVALPEGNPDAASIWQLGRQLFVAEGDAASCSRVAKFLLESPEESDAEADDDNESLFEVYLETGDIYAAFSVATRYSNASRRSNNSDNDEEDGDDTTRARISSRRLETLVEAACKRGRLYILCALPWTKEERTSVDACLRRLAVGQNKRQTVIDNGLFDRHWGHLYAFRAWRYAWDEAARASLDLAAHADAILGHTVALELRLGASQLERWRSTATVGLAARVAACISLSLLRPHAFVVTRATKDAPYTLQLNSESDLSAGVRLGAARLSLLLRGDHDALAATRTARDLGIGLAQAGAYIQALELADLIDTQSLDNCIVAALAKRCVELDASEFDESSSQASSADDPWRPDPSPLVKSNLSIYPARTIFGPRSGPTWNALRAYLETQPDVDRNWNAAKAATHAILASGRQILPHWLMTRFSGGFARANADPSALLRLYLKYDRLPEALHLASDLLDNIEIKPGSKEELGHTTFVPFSHIEAILRAASSKAQQTKQIPRTSVAFDDDLPTFPEDDAELLTAALSRLRNSLRRYLTNLAHATQLDRAARTLT
uniref:NUP160 C-terminal TPR domain-containing protein n=1 Tax=Aureoumbra lagunensis TaxID=44058 RepID=A0A7S3JQI6_9STRA|mmetsp:Transcript_12699/g.19047  ORF Transcript_12699/g.19047 Transcript_12699/m.19047 type:complete len:1364 (+) Transcript_12699:20-4111(+)